MIENSLKPMNFTWRKNMKVIQVMPEFGLAGAEIMCENLSIQLYRHDIDIIVISLYDYHSAITERLEQQGIKIIYLNKKRGFDLHMFFRLYRIFRKEKPDVVHTHLYAMQYAVPAAVIAGVQTRIHTVHSIAQKESKPFAQKMNFIFYHVFHVIPVALSKEVQQTIQERYRLARSKIPIIYNGVDLEKCMQKETYCSGNVLRYIHVGRFAAVKNHMMLLEAFAKVHKKLPESELILIGAGELEECIRKKIRDLGIEDHVVMTGLKKNIYPFLQKADVFVLPSVYEGMPMTLIEAMGTGLPVIATAVGGIPSMIRSYENGILIPVKTDDLVHAMLLLSDQNLREKLGLNARITAEKKFSSETMYDRYRKIYRKK